MHQKKKLLEKKGQLGYTKANDQDFDILIMQMVSVQSLLRHQPLATRNAKMGLYYIYPFKSFLACTIKRASLLEYYSVRSFPLILHKILYFIFYRHKPRHANKRGREVGHNAKEYSIEDNFSRVYMYDSSLSERE